MPWVSIDDKFHSNPKVISAGLDGAGLYARALAYCADHLTDGYVPQEWANEVATRKVREKVTEAGLWVMNGTRYFIPDYLDFNPSKAEVLKRRAEVSKMRAEAGRKGAEKRWQTT